MSELTRFKSLAVMHRWAVRQQTPPDATPTPFPSLNAICGGDGGGLGLARGWFVTIGGGTGQGKSLLAQNVAAHAMHQGKTVGFLSLEMSEAELLTRFYAMVTRTPIKALERGRFNLDSFERAWGTMSDLQTLPGDFLSNVDPLDSIDAVMNAAYRMKDEGASLIVVDYLQLVSTGDEENIYKQVTSVGGELRKFAHKEGVTVLALSQYNTPTGRDTSQPPTMYGLMGGGTIANNGDLVLLLDHSRYERDAMDRSIARTWMLVPKNRHGETGEVAIAWDYKTLTCREGLPDEERFWPAGGK